MKVIIFTLTMALLWLSLEGAYSMGAKKGFDAGFEAGKAEAQTPAFIVETCSKFWWGSEREAKKMIDKYCEVKK